ncbi:MULTISPECIES: hypothetical protein [unclassified Bacillus (in: firmicutes)]|uniref:hypothetical protein n=1 Tax=unclassified Bacillus (in: firmicutes) TaxID=185979 RepID=UPI0004E1F76E|nr:MULTISPECIES: hypothetical protein [unclassified Bacillus (in: firmicutes)]
MKAAGYISIKVNGFSDIRQEYFENGVLRKNDEENDEEQFELDSLLTSDLHIFFQDRLLTTEEKSKIKSLIEIVLKD